MFPSARTAACADDRWYPSDPSELRRQVEQDLAQVRVELSPYDLTRGRITYRFVKR